MVKSSNLTDRKPAMVGDGLFRPLEQRQHVSNSASTSQGQDSISSLNRHRNAGPWTRLSRLERC